MDEPIIKFEPAQLHKGKIWYISYKVLDPVLNKLVRKRVKCNRVKNKKERETYAKNIIHEINRRLYAGWNPLINADPPLKKFLLIECLNEFMRTKEPDLRIDTIRSYNSFVNNFNSWLRTAGLLDIPVRKFNKQHAVSYMDYISTKKKLSAVTFNNYKRFMNVFFNWLIETDYLSENPFDGIKPKKISRKKRVVIKEEDRRIIREYLKSNDYPFYIVIELVFYALLRPKEISYLKPKYFDLERQTIFIPDHVAKNKNDRIVTIPDVVMSALINFPNFNTDADNFLISKNWRGGKSRIDSREFTRKWTKLRKVLKLNPNYQLYSLRDSGIIQMLKEGISPHEVMIQADHSSLEITSIYMKHANPSGNPRIKHKLK